MQRKLFLAVVCPLMLLAIVTFVAGRKGWNNNPWGARSRLAVASNGALVLQPGMQGSAMVVVVGNPHWRVSSTRTNTSPRPAQ